ncbi:hypothetical protein D3C73_963350 [compost metagenome]
MASAEFICRNVTSGNQTAFFQIKAVIHTLKRLPVETARLDHPSLVADGDRCMDFVKVIKGLLHPGNPFQQITLIARVFRLFEQDQQL